MERVTEEGDYPYLCRATPLDFSFYRHAEVELPGETVKPDVLPESDPEVI